MALAPGLVIRGAAAVRKPAHDHFVAVDHLLAVHAEILALVQGPALARVIRVFGRNLDPAQAIALANKLFSVLEPELTERDFLVGKAPTLANIALYTYTAHAPEGHVSLEPYPLIRAWLARIEALPRFVPMARTET